MMKNIRNTMKAPIARRTDFEQVGKNLWRKDDDYYRLHAMGKVDGKFVSPQMVEVKWQGRNVAPTNGNRAFNIVGHIEPELTFIEYGER